jgi:fibronectin-binding autotransporter adhesin
MKIQKPIKCLCHRFLVTVALLLTADFIARADYQSTVLNDQPLAFYPINSSVDPTGQTATDLSGNNNNGTYNGTDPEFNTVPGPSQFIPNALFFDGFTSFVDLSSGGNPTLLNFGGTITMEAWVQPASPTVGSGPPADILAKGYDGTNEMALRAQGGIYYGGTYNNNTGGGSASGGQQTTNWTYLVSTYDGTNWNLYVNTKLVGQGSDAIGAINFTAPWAIGDGTTGSAGGNSGDLRFFSGNLTEVALYTNALTPAQVLNHFCVGELGTSSSSSVPIIITQPQPQTAFVGGTVTFSVGVASALSTTNQWFKNNVALAGKTNATLTLTNVGGADAVNYSVVVGNNNGTTNSVSASLTLLATGNSLKWNSGGANGVWDTGISADWLNLSNSAQTVFNANDQVLFDDTVGVSNNVIINGTVSPSTLTVNSSVNNFTFNQGTSPLISGVGSLIKNGSSLLTIFSPQGFSGVVKISGGTIYAGNNCFKSVSSITITNNATLDLGGGTFNDNKPITVSGTGVNGQGAIYNSYDDYPGEVCAITLAGDTTLGGINRWDLNSGSTISGPHKVTLNWNDPGDSSYGQWTGVTIATNVGDIEVTNGKLGIVNMGSTFGNPAGNVIIDPGASMLFYSGDPGYAKNYDVKTNGSIQLMAGTPGFNGNVTLENGANFDAFSSSSGNYTVSGPVTLTGVAHILVGESNLFFVNVISGTGGFVFDAYNHEILLGAPNTYSGPTVIGGGLTLGLTNNGSISHSSLIWLGGATIDVSGRTDNTLALTSGQTLGGIGTISGTLVVPAGATISPAGTNITLGMVEGSSPTGTINANNNVTLNGTTILKLNGSGVNDQIASGASIAYSGTLNLVNISGLPYAVGNSFQIFNAVNITGSFANITPTTPGAGLAWDTSQLNSLGFLNVVAGPSQPVISSTKVSSGNLIFSGTGGTTNGSYLVLTTTNLAKAFIVLTTNNFDATGAFSVTNAINPGTPQSFYRIEIP